MAYADPEIRRQYYRDYGQTARRKEWKRKWAEENKVRVNECRKARRGVIGDKINEQKRASYYKNREETRVRLRARYQERKEKILAECAKWRKENADKVKEYQEKYRCDMADEFKRKRRVPSGRYSQYKHAAKKRSMAFELTKEEFMAFWGKPCEYCGDVIEGIGIDRIDNGKGYEIGNVVSCCRWCNIMKLNNGAKEFIDHCRKVVAKNEGK